MVSKKPIRFYFILQFRMLNRQLADFGLYPLAGYVLLVLTFLCLSLYLFLKTEFAVFVYFFLSISFIYILSESGRNSFLKSCFKTIDYFAIRIIENSMLALPFAAFFLFKSEFFPAVVLMIASGVLVIFNFRNTFNLTIPTPFSKKPFEFIVGFRNSFYVFILAYFLAFMAVTAVNFNLGIFALLVVLFICFTFYVNPENDFYVWIFSTSPAGFLAHKIKVAILYSTLLCLPVVAALCIFFPENTAAILGFQSLGYLYLVTVILAKYAAHPNKMNLPQALVIAFSISFPPLLIGVIPYFFMKSVKSLKEILE